ncbi:MAG: metallophosphoesterase [Candidatus Hermodarchaeota archaeon]
MPVKDTHAENLGQEETVIVVSDIHLGHIEFEHKKAFRVLLENLLKQDLLDEAGNKIPCHRLILCGDIFDFWRRNNEKVLQENSDIIQLLDALQRKEDVHLHLVLGNHDYFLRKALPHYNFTFVKTLVLTRPDVSFQFQHGHQFDPIQAEELFDLLSLTTGDTLGAIFQYVFESLKNAEAEVKKGVQTAISCLTGKNIEIRPDLAGEEELEPVISEQDVRLLIAELLRLPQEKFGSMIESEAQEVDDDLGPEICQVKFIDQLFSFTKIVRNAAKALKNSKDAPLLIFGHTHRPFIYINRNTGLTFANTGGWERMKVDASDWRYKYEDKTFLVINRQTINLYKFLLNGRGQLICTARL